MTGFGSATREDGARRVTVEVRTLNHRYLKIGVKLPRALSSLETEVEPIVKHHVRRGSVSVSCRYKDGDAIPAFRVNLAAAQSYRAQIAELWDALGLHEPGGHDRVEPLLSLPGVIRAEDEDGESALSQEAQSLVLGTLEEALGAMVTARQQEGDELMRVLLEHGQQLESFVNTVAERAPDVPKQHRDRLLQRTRALLQELKAEHEVTESDLHRELCLLADKADIAEEINRLKTHLQRYRTILEEGGEVGRKLDFLLQEMLRETNTIGSKANNADIAHAVVEMKVEVERMKEQVQNLE